MGNYKVFWLMVSVVYTFLLVYFSLADVDGIMPDSKTYPFDKLFHFIAYVILSVFWLVWFKKTFGQKGILPPLIVLLFFGMVLESVQEIISPFRTFDWLDLTANCLGVLCGTIIATYFTKSKVKMN